MKRRIPDNSTLWRPGEWRLHAVRLKSLLVALPAGAAMLLALLPPRPCDAQYGPPQAHTTIIQPPIGHHVGDNGDLSGAPAADDERLMRARNADRQKSLISDTNKLLRLVNELNAEIARANTGSLTAEQLHKVAEIEKLAHNVKDKMSTSVRATPAFQTPVQPARY